MSVLQCCSVRVPKSLAEWILCNSPHHDTRSNTSDRNLHNICGSFNLCTGSNIGPLWQRRPTCQTISTDDTTDDIYLYYVFMHVCLCVFMYVRTQSKNDLIFSCIVSQFRRCLFSTASYFHSCPSSFNIFLISSHILSLHRQLNFHSRGREMGLMTSKTPVGRLPKLIIRLRQTTRVKEAKLFGLCRQQFP